MLSAPRVASLLLCSFAPHRSISCCILLKPKTYAAKSVCKSPWGVTNRKALFPSLLVAKFSILITVHEKEEETLLQEGFFLGTEGQPQAAVWNPRFLRENNAAANVNLLEIIYPDGSAGMVLLFKPTVCGIRPIIAIDSLLRASRKWVKHHLRPTFMTFCWL